MKLINLKAKIFFDPESIRNLPIKDGYRPLFDTFHKSFKISGKLKFIDDTIELDKNQAAIVVITIPEYDQDTIEINVGNNFNFFEGEILIGHGTVLEKL